MTHAAVALMRGLDRVVELLLLAILVSLVAIGGLQVVWRFVLNDPLAWVVEVSVILMIWGTMLAGYIGVRRNSHLSADFMGLAMRPRVRWLLEGLTMVLCLVFLAVYGWTSLAVIDSMEGIPFASIPLTQPAEYWSLPVGAALMGLAFCVRLAEHVRRGPAAEG